MDRKVTKKQQKIDENEKKWEEKKLIEEKRKKDLEENIKKSVKKSKKLNKQRNKDKRKRINKKQNNESKTENTKIKNVPLNCKKLVNEGDMVYIVPGNGACASNSAAAHLFHDENLGPKLRIQMNQFLAKHYEHYKNIFPCSEEEPFIRRLKGEEIIFKDLEELKKFLLTSQEAGFMWSDSEDLKIISDLYQIGIKIITTKGSTDNNPIVNWIQPDKDMNEVAELKNVKIEDMVLLHEYDNHFDLVVSKNSDLIEYGGLSDRIDVVTLNVENEDKVADRKEQKSNCDTTVLDLKREIATLKRKNELYEKQYIDCEKELRKKTEEVERLKTELRDTELKISLENEIRANENLDTSEEVENLAMMKNSGFRRNGPHTESSPIENKQKSFNSKNCADQSKKQKELMEHVPLKHRRGKQECNQCDYQGCIVDDMKEHKTNHEEFNCYDCPYQGNSQDLLQKHIRFAHTIEKYKCVKCNYQGSGGEDLYKHIKNEHTKEQNIEWANCKQTSVEVNESSAHIDRRHSLVRNIKCNTCGKDFNSKSELMNHRKLEHTKLVATCKNYLDGQCNRENTCWWIHRQGKEEDIECFFCEQKFNTKALVMIHRKKEHPKTVKSCQKFPDNKCSYNDEKCWFMHENNLVFRNGKENLKNK